MALSALAIPSDVPHAQPLVFAEVFRDHMSFVWRAARRLGVSAASLDDVVQEVFVVVHRRLHEFEGRSSLKSWLYGIVVGIVRNHRRTLRRRPESELPAIMHDERSASPHESAERSQAAQALLQFLETLDDDRREIFVMVDLEQESVASAAQALDLNVNTAHARLRTARSDFDAFVTRYRAREQRRQP